MENIFLTAMGISIIFISIKLYRIGFYRPSAYCFALAGLSSFLWKAVFLVYGETDLTRIVSESFEISFAVFVASGVLFFISDLYAEYSKRLEIALEERKESEEKYRMVIENIQDGAFIIQDARLQYVNEAFAGMAGYKTAEVMGKDFRVFVAEEDRELVASRYYKRQAGENIPKEYDFRMIHKDGTRIAVNMNVGLINYHGKIASMGIIRDITARKRAEDEKNRLLKAIASSTDGITIADENDRFIYVNAAYAGMFGYAEEELIGETWRKITPSDIIPSAEKGLEDTLHNKDIGLLKGEFPGIRKDGEIIPTDVMGTALWNEKRDYAGHICIVRDITERKRVEEKLREGERFLESIFTSIQDGIGIIDTDMNIIRVNKAAESWYPHAVPMARKKCYEAYHNRKDRCELCPAWETLRKGNSSHKVTPKHGPDGKEVGWVEIYSYPLKDTTSGDMKGVIEYVRDISERKKVENALFESEKRYRTLFESAWDAIFIIDTEGEKKGQIVAANNAAARMHGYTVDELLALNIKDLDAPESSDKVHQIIGRILNGENLKIELDHIRKDGTIFPVEVSSGLFELGGHKFILGFDRDITERKRAEEALSLSNLVVENSQTVLFRWKAAEGWPVEYVSNNVVQFGYDPVDFLSGKLLFASIIHQEDIERVSREVQEYSGKGKDRFKQEYRIIAKNGTIHWVDDRTVIERSKNGEITHYQGIIIDIDERKSKEEAVKKYNLHLEESNHMKELFTDIMHHDLMNPLNVAKGYAELFLDDETDFRKRTYLESLKRNLGRGIELIENATKFSKLESTDRIEFEDMDLKIVIDEVVENLSPISAEAGMSIENKLPERMPAMANKMISEIFENIMTNAVKYASQGKRIVIEGNDGNNAWLIKIKDFGPGIEDDDKKLIFNRFNREEKKGVKGSGLGMAIAARIVRLHNGRIWVEDNPDGGAVFVVEIPNPK